MSAERDGQAGAATERGHAQGGKLLDGRLHFVVTDLGHPGAPGDDRLRLQAVQRRDFAGQRAQRCHLEVALLGDLLQGLVPRLERFLFRPHLVEAHDFHQHAAIGAGHAGDGQHADQGPHQEDLNIVQWNGDLAELSLGVPGDKKNVEAFTQTYSDPGTWPDCPPGTPVLTSESPSGMPARLHLQPPRKAGWPVGPRVPNKRAPLNPELQKMSKSNRAGRGCQRTTVTRRCDGLPGKYMNVSNLGVNGCGKRAAGRGGAAIAVRQSGAPSGIYDWRFWNDYCARACYSEISAPPKSLSRRVSRKAFFTGSLGLATLSSAAGVPG